LKVLVNFIDFGNKDIIPILNGIYVAKNDYDEYRRIKLDKKITRGSRKVHLIDTCGYDVIDEVNIFHITKRFAEIKPFAIKEC